MKLPEIIENTVTHFSRLPGVGGKTALRQTLIMSRWTKEELRLFGESVRQIADLKKCNECGFFSEVELCNICSSDVRAAEKTLCVVESITDCMAIENSRQYNGCYHILGGVLNPLLGIGPDEINIAKLVARVVRDEIENVILAVGPTVEGDATCSYIKYELDDKVNVERIGFGVPMGGSLEYLDALTISKALENKKRLV